MNNVLLVIFFSSFLCLSRVQASQEHLEGGTCARSYECAPSLDPVVRCANVRAPLREAALKEHEKRIEMRRSVFPIEEARAARALAQKQYQESLQVLEKTLADFSSFHEDCLKTWLKRMPPDLVAFPLREILARAMLGEVMLHMGAIECREKGIREIMSARVFDATQRKMDYEVGLAPLQAGWYRLFSYRNQLCRFLSGEESLSPSSVPPKGILWERLQDLKRDLSQTRRTYRAWCAAQESYKDAMFPGEVWDIAEPPPLRLRSPDRQPEEGKEAVFLPPLI